MIQIWPETKIRHTKKTIPESASVPRKQEENFGQLKNREPIL
jgi:hypothetical protein